MARVYLSYNTQDVDLARSIATSLQERGHEVTIDIASLAPGANWRTVLNDALKSSDAFVAILTENALRSQFVASEVGAARAFADADGEMIVIPIVADKMAIPPFISDLFAIQSPERDMVRIADEIDRALASFAASKAVREKKREVLETNTGRYVDEAIVSLRMSEHRDRRLAHVWYAAGVVALIAGIGFGFWSLRDVATSKPPATLDVEWLLFARALLKAVVIIGLLIAVTKYCFILGKSYMSESLKSADRVHAISYGKFYLQVFGATADHQELKEVFQHWNIDRPSAFATTAVEQFDPKYSEAVVEVVRAFAKAGEKK
ncbi:MAG TPA: toll/interleukin-1 receptor domain-containing protein [Thermoanaerobaculia bacterium]|nr:toll/interleukin-1 receptor domain-containing protein [Thermoanaerobaculia bacterium]